MLSVFTVVEGLTYDVLSLFNKWIFVPIIAALVFILLVKISEKLPERVKSIISKIPTMVVYGLHPFIGLIVGTIFEKLPYQGLLHYVISFLLSVIITSCLALILRQNKLLNFLFNGDRI